MALDDGKLRGNCFKDIEYLLKWVEQQPELDKDKIVVDGGSYGGFLVLGSMIRFADKLCGGMERVGISNFVTFLEKTADYRRDLRRQEYGDERIPEMKEFLKELSPLTQAQKINKPMFIVQGLNDPRVPITESEQIVEAIKKNGVEVWYMIGKNEGHGFSKKQNIDEMTWAEVMWLRKFILQDPQVLNWKGTTPKDSLSPPSPTPSPQAKTSNQPNNQLSSKPPSPPNPTIPFLLVTTLLPSILAFAAGFFLSRHLKRS